MTTETITEDKKTSTQQLQICIKDLDVAYQNTVALVNINLDIFRGGIIGICGPNGSGKSTLLKSILGLVKPVRGKITFFDYNNQITPRDKINIGYVPQLNKIDRNFPALVKDVVAMGRYRQIGFFKRVNYEDPNIVNALMDVGMWRFRNRPIGHLSGGQQQKVMLARALSSNPDILLLDEPTAALDFRVQKSIMELIKKLHQEKNLTILLITHNMSFLKEYTTKVVCLNKQIIWEGLPDDPQLQSIIEKIFY